MTIFIEWSWFYLCKIYIFFFVIKPLTDFHLVVSKLVFVDFGCWFEIVKWRTYSFHCVQVSITLENLKSYLGQLSWIYGCCKVNDMKIIAKEWDLSSCHNEWLMLFGSGFMHPSFMPFIYLLSKLVILVILLGLLSVSWMKFPRKRNVIKKP